MLVGERTISCREKINVEELVNFYCIWQGRKSRGEPAYYWHVTITPHVKVPWLVLDVRDLTMMGG